MQGRPRSLASNARCAHSLAHSRIVFLPDGCRFSTAARKGRTEVAEHQSRRRAGSGRRDRAAAGRRQTAAAGNPRLSVMGYEARRQSQEPGADASVSPVSAPDQDHIQLDREWTLVHQKGEAGVEATRLSDRFLQHGQAGAVAAEASQEEPGASETGHQETASAALKYLRKAQKSLGQLNDDANSRSLATALQREGVEAPLQFLDAEREKRLLRRAAAAYRKLAKLKP